jgi:hypothetical protein
LFLQTKCPVCRAEIQSFMRFIDPDITDFEVRGPRRPPAAAPKSAAGGSPGAGAADAAAGAAAASDFGEAKLPSETPVMMAGNPSVVAAQLLLRQQQQQQLALATQQQLQALADITTDLPGSVSREESQMVVSASGVDIAMMSSRSMDVSRRGTQVRLAVVVLPTLSNVLVFVPCFIQHATFPPLGLGSEVELADLVRPSTAPASAEALARWT